MVALDTVSNQYLGGEVTGACSAELQAMVDHKIIEIVRTQHEKARKILSENRSALDMLAQHLYEKETITGEEFMELLNSCENSPVKE